MAYQSVQEALSAVSEMQADGKRKSVESISEVLNRMAATADAVFFYPFINNLDQLDSIVIEESTLPLVFIYTALFRHAIATNTAILPPLVVKVYRFLESAVPEYLRASPDRTHTLAELIFQTGHLTRMGVVAQPLVLLVQKYAKPGCITNLHPIAFKACLLSHHFKAALPLITAQVSQTQRPISIDHVLLYMHYSGMLFTGLKKYDKAIECFGFNLIAPCKAVIKDIQLESYKKFVLVSLIATGKVPQLSKTDVGQLQQAAQALCQPYTQLQKAFKLFSNTSSAAASSAISQVQAVVAKYASEFTHDGNYGLAKQVVAAAPIHKIKQLTETFLTLSLPDIAAQSAFADVARQHAPAPTASAAAAADGSASTAAAGPAPVDEVAIERAVLGMIAAGQVRAAIQHTPTSGPDAGTAAGNCRGMVAFLDDDNAYDDDRTSTALGTRILQVLEAAQRVNAIDHSIAPPMSAKDLRQQLREVERAMFHRPSDFDEMDINV